MTNWRDWFQNSVNEHGDSLEASHYDSARSFYVRQRLVLNWLGDIQGKTVLDVGPGAGHFSKNLTHRNHVIGVDFIPTMLHYSANKGIIPVQGNGLQLPIASGSADVVICEGVLQHVDNSTDFIAELLRVRKPGGVLFLGTLNRDSLVRWLYYRLTPHEEIMHTFTIPDLVARIQSLVPGAKVDVAPIYYPLPGYRWTGAQPGLSRYLSTAYMVRVG